MGKGYTRDDLDDTCWRLRKSRHNSFINRKSMSVFPPSLSNPNTPDGSDSMASSMSERSAETNAVGSSMQVQALSSSSNFAASVPSPSTSPTLTSTQTATSKSSAIHSQSHRY